MENLCSNMINFKSKNKDFLTKLERIESFNLNCKNKNRNFSRKTGVLEPTVRKPFHDNNILLYKNKPLICNITNLNIKPKITCSSNETTLKHARTQVVVNVERLPATVLNKYLKKCVVADMFCNMSANNLQPGVTINKSLSKINIQPEYTHEDVRIFLNKNIVNVERCPNARLAKYFKNCRVVIPVMLFNKSVTTTKSLSNDVHKTLLNDSHEYVNKALNTSETKDENSIPTLRKRKQNISYTKFLRGSSLLHQENSKNHIPVYKKPQSKKEKTKKKNDVYEFNSDSNEKTAKQRRNTLDNSVPFEKNMKLMMYEIEAQNKKQVKKKGKLKKKNHPVKHNDWQYFEGSRSITKSVNRAKEKKVSIHQEPERNKIKVLQNVVLNVTDSSSKSLTDTEEIGESLNYSLTIPREKNTKMNLSTLKQMKLNNEEYSLKLDDTHDTESDEVENENISSHNDSESITKNTGEAEMQSDDAILNEFLDFDEPPIAESTVLDTRCRTSSPWRFDLGLKRNPHFLQYKDTSLPNYNQEMVIDNNIVERISSGNKTPNNIHEHSKKTKQDSILSYIVGKNAPKSTAILDRSLYDIHELSPIKRNLNPTETASKNSYSQKDKYEVLQQVLREKIDNFVYENVASPVDRRDLMPFEKKDKTKRKILAEKSDNLIIMRHNRNHVEIDTDKAKQQILGEEVDDVREFIESKDIRAPENMRSKKTTDKVKRKVFDEDVDNLPSMVHDVKETVESKEIKLKKSLGKKRAHGEQQILGEQVDNLLRMLCASRKENSPVKQKADKAKQQIFENMENRINISNVKNTPRAKERRLSKNSPVTKGVDIVKQHILGEIVDNLANITNNVEKTPERNRKSDADDINNFNFENAITDHDSRSIENQDVLKQSRNVERDKKSSTYDIDHCFGFENSSSNSSYNESETKCEENKDKRLIIKPLRLNDYLEIIKYSKNKSINKNFIPHSNKNVEASIEEQESVPGAVLENGTVSNVGLFEDLIVNKNETTKSYRRKRKRRVRKLYAVESDEDNENNDQTKKRKKNIRTKQEEQEAEKWAKEFNAMCQEVDDHSLEIE